MIACDLKFQKILGNSQTFESLLLGMTQAQPAGRNPVRPLFSICSLLTASPASLASFARASILTLSRLLFLPQGQVLVLAPSLEYRCLPHWHLKIRYAIYQKTIFNYDKKFKDHLEGSRTAFMTPSWPGLLVTLASPISVFITAPLVIMFLLMK